MMKYTLLLLLAGCSIYELPDVGPLQPTLPDAGDSDGGFTSSGPCGDSDPAAIELMRKLSIKSRERWPAWASQPVRLGLPEKKKA